MSSNLKVTVYADAQPFPLSYVYTGLSDLAREGRIDLDFVFPWSRMQKRPAFGDVTLWLTVSDRDNKQHVNVVFDLHDRSDKFIHERLLECDVYFKRSFHEPDVLRLKPELSLKVLPFGLVYPCRSLYGRGVLRRSLGYFVARVERAPASLIDQSMYGMYLLREYYRSPVAETGAVDVSDSKKPCVLFQTQVYSPDETNDDAHRLNELRVATVRTLRKVFKDRFVGGLLPSKYARAMYPDCVATGATKREDYLRLVRSCSIGVHTRGLHNSIAWKLPEYLAAGMCVVSEPLRNQLSRPLNPGEHYLTFSSPEECAFECERLLSDSQLMQGMSRANLEYFQSDVLPSRRLWSCLVSAMRMKQDVAANTGFLMQEDRG